MQEAFAGKIKRDTFSNLYSTKWGRRGQEHLYGRINSRPNPPPLFFLLKMKKMGNKFFYWKEPASFSFNERKSSVRRAKSGRSIKRHFDWSSTDEQNGTAVASAVAAWNRLFSQQHRTRNIHVPIFKVQHFFFHREIESINKLLKIKKNGICAHFYDIKSNVWLVYTITLGVYLISYTQVIVLVTHCGVASDSISVVNPVCTSVDCTHIQMRWMMDRHLRSPAADVTTFRSEVCRHQARVSIRMLPWSWLNMLETSCSSQGHSGHML